MKKLYTLSFCLFLLLSLGSYAQTRIAGSVSVPVLSGNPKSGLPGVMMVVDTLVPPSYGSPFMCDTAFRCYDFDYALPVDTGYVYGTSKYNGTECAQKYYATGGVSEVLVQYGAKAGTSGITMAKIYSINPLTKGPLAVLGTSNTVTTGNISLTAYTKYTFSSPVAVNTSFAAAVVFPTTATSGDTVGVVSTKIYCSSGDTLAWINFPNLGGWKSCPRAYSVPYDATANHDLVIYPVIDLATGVGAVSNTNLFSLLGVHPNPASDIVFLDYQLQEPSFVSIEVFDLTGRIIQTFSENVSAGMHQLGVDVRELPSGQYYYTVKAGNDRLTSKFSVAK